MQPRPAARPASPSARSSMNTPPQLTQRQSSVALGSSKNGAQPGSTNENRPPLRRWYSGGAGVSQARSRLVATFHGLRSSASSRRSTSARRSKPSSSASDSGPGTANRRRSASSHAWRASPLSATASISAVPSRPVGIVATRSSNAAVAASLGPLGAVGAGGTEAVATDGTGAGGVARLFGRARREHDAGEGQERGESWHACDGRTCAGRRQVGSGDVHASFRSGHRRCAARQRTSSVSSIVSGSSAARVTSQATVASTIAPPTSVPDLRRFARPDPDPERGQHDLGHEQQRDLGGGDRLCPRLNSGRPTPSATPPVRQASCAVVDRDREARSGERDEGRDHTERGAGDERRDDGVGTTVRPHDHVEEADRHRDARTAKTTPTTSPPRARSRP